MTEWRDYVIRVWGTPDRYVDIDQRGRLDYARGDGGHGMQTLAEEGTREYEIILDRCDEVRRAILKLDMDLMLMS